MSEELDRGRISNKLDELEEYSGELDQDLPDKETDYARNRVLRRACEKDFELICQTIIDICNLIISQTGLGYPEDNRQSIEKLVNDGIVPEKLGDRLKDMISFRNLIVHRYGSIDDAKAYNHLKEGKKDFYRFVETINSFLENL